MAALAASVRGAMRSGPYTFRPNSAVVSSRRSHRRTGRVRRPRHPSASDRDRRSTCARSYATASRRFSRSRPDPRVARQPAHASGRALSPSPRRHRANCSKTGARISRRRPVVGIGEGAGEGEGGDVGTAHVAQASPQPDRQDLQTERVFDISGETPALRALGATRSCRSAPPPRHSALPSGSF
jgi:hypothetical protein